jgi:hypothetical protein
MHIAQTRVSPSILSAGSLLLACGWFVAAVIFFVHGAGTANDTVPDFWVAVFFVSGPFAVSLAGSVFQFRRRDHSPFQKIDRIAIVLAGIIVIGYVSFVASLYFRTQRLRQEQPNQGAAANRPQALRLTMTDNLNIFTALTAPCRAVAELGR